jgi:hypothetical protein
VEELRAELLLTRAAARREAATADAVLGCPPAEDPTGRAGVVRGVAVKVGLATSGAPRG